MNKLDFKLLNEAVNLLDREAKIKFELKNGSFRTEIEGESYELKLGLALIIQTIIKNMKNDRIGKKYIRDTLKEAFEMGMEEIYE